MKGEKYQKRSKGEFRKLTGTETKKEKKAIRAREGGKQSGNEEGTGSHTTRPERFSWKKGLRFNSEGQVLFCGI